MERMRVRLYIPNYWVEGTIFFAETKEASEFMGIKPKLFLPIIEATIYSLKSNRVLSHPKFLALNRKSIERIEPVNKEDIKKVFVIWSSWLRGEIQIPQPVGDGVLEK
ncbi:MAG: hypothetical protein KAX20_04815 [Candidatus Omnitrophica bacterium]|nr:hypothetical protein [Candidatus Omnitrophota bacterium]